MPNNPAEILQDGPIRRFADSGIQSAIDKALLTLPPLQHGAVVAYANQDKVSLAAVAKLGTKWSVVGVLEKSHNGPLEAEAVVRFSW